MSSIRVENVNETNMAVLEDSVMATLGSNTTHGEVRLLRGESTNLRLQTPFVGTSSASAGIINIRKIATAKFFEYAIIFYSL